MIQATAFLLCLCCSSLIQAAPLIFGVPDYPPNSYVTENEVGGFDVDIMRRLAKEMSIELEFSPCSWVRCLELMKSGKIDMLGSFNFSVEREQFAIYIGDAYTPGRVIFIVQKGKSASIKRYEDLQGLVIGKETSAKLFDRFDDDDTLQIYPSTSLDTLLTLLGSGRIDTVAYSDTTVNITLQRPQYRGKFDIAEFESGNLGYFALSKTSAHVDLAPELQRVFESLKTEGFVAKVLNEYRDIESPRVTGN